MVRWFDLLEVQFESAVRPNNDAVDGAICAFVTNDDPAIRLICYYVADRIRLVGVRNPAKDEYQRRDNADPGCDDVCPSHLPEVGSRQDQSD